jgi:hypothetical protein
MTRASGGQVDHACQRDAGACECGVAGIQKRALFFACWSADFFDGGGVDVWRPCDWVGSAFSPSLQGEDALAAAMR